MSILTRLFGDPNERVVNDIRPIVTRVNALEPEFEKIPDADLPAKTAELKARLQGGETLDDILPEAFALVREGAKRTLHQRHFDVQLIGGIVLHQGRIAEMRTGEGKTLVATAPLFLNALAGKGAHLVTVNDYLARLHAVLMGQVFHVLGLSTGCIVHDQSYVYDPTYHVEVAHDGKGDLVRDAEQDPHDAERDTVGTFKVQQSYLRPVPRREAYAADITYGTNNEFGFDYLRDNMVYETHRMAQRGHAFVVVDEVDSILIDEARTPLIISAPDAESSKLYEKYAKLVPRLGAGEDYKVDEKFRAVTLTEAGVDKMEKLAGEGNLYEEGKVRELHALESSLRAMTLFHRDKEYVVKDGEIVIVDEFTGRLMPGRRYSEGLHQAIEAKEGVRVQEESRTLATVTFQNYFRMYDKLAGMTGTAATNAEEFSKVYKLEVVTIPTNKPMVRKDESDLVFKTEEGKFTAVAREVKARHEKGQPVLIGTVSIEKNEYLSALLKREGIPHELLNAKNHEREGAIIAQAGRMGAVTVATNMAGRGVDIILGGNPPDPAEAARVREAGGLHIIGTERHEARRIDNQLRGRAGRQGDPGSSQFFLSLEDDLMRVFGGDKIKGLMERLGVPDDEAIQNRMITRSISQAQGRIEGYNFDIRKHVLEYDEVMNKHREIAYKKRREILEAAEAKEGPGTKLIVLEMIGHYLRDLVMGAVIAPVGEDADADARARAFVEAVARAVPLMPDFATRLLEAAKEGFSDPEALIGDLGAYTEKMYDGKEQQLGAKALRQAEAAVLLQTLDMMWMDHLESMEHLRDSVRLRAYGQRDPLIEYKNEGHRAFKGLLEAFGTAVAQTVFRVGPVADRGGVSMRQAREEKRDIFGDESPMKREAEDRDAISPGEAKPVVGRNDPCPCGSGKKYKKCHGNS